MASPGDTEAGATEKDALIKTTDAGATDDPKEVEGLAAVAPPSEFDGSVKDQKKEQKKALSLHLKNNVD